MILAAAAIAVIAITFTTAVLQSRASSTEDQTSYKYYKNVVVSSAYNMDDIIVDYADAHYSSERAYIREVEQINHLDVDDVRPGDHLVIPYYSEDFR